MDFPPFIDYLCDSRSVSRGLHVNAQSGGKAQDFGIRSIDQSCLSIADVHKPDFDSKHQVYAA